MFGVSHTFVFVHVVVVVRRSTRSTKSPSSSVHRQSAPTNAKSFAGNWNVTVFVSPGSSAIFVKSRRRLLSGTMLATRSLEYSNTASLPARLPVFFTSTLTVSTSSAVNVALSTFRLLYSKVV